MREIDRCYFAKRASDELAAAERASSPEAAEIHRQLALRYSATSQEDDGSAGAGDLTGPKSA